MLLREDGAHLLGVISLRPTKPACWYAVIHPGVTVYHVGFLLGHVLTPLLLAIGRRPEGLASLLMILLSQQELALSALLALREAGARVLLELLHARSSAESISKVASHVTWILLEHIAIDSRPLLLLLSLHLCCHISWNASNLANVRHASVTHGYVAAGACRVENVRLRNLLLLLLLELLLLLSSL